MRLMDLGKGAFLMATEEQQTSGETIRQSVAERAYAIWENEGKPHGRDVDHWLRAEVEAGKTEVNVDPPLEPEKQPAASAKSSKKIAARRK